MKLTIEKTKEFVKQSIEDSNRPNYPFRSRYRHTLRVMMWACRLQEELGGDLEVLKYSSLLHDCDYNGVENHAITSYRKAKTFLDSFDLDQEFKDKVLEGVRYHNERDVDGLCKETYMLMDADELDEVGALCIIWDTLAEQHEMDTVSYSSVVKRIEKYIPRFYENIERLHFNYSKAVYLRKLKFQEQFIEEALEELGNE